MTDPQPLVTAKESDGSVELTLKYSDRRVIVALSVGDSFALRNQLAAAEAAAIQWDIDNGKMAMVNV